MILTYNNTRYFLFEICPFQKQALICLLATGKNEKGGDLTRKNQEERGFVREPFGSSCRFV
jgi:hypothetical protein